MRSSAATEVSVTSSMPTLELSTTREPAAANGSSSVRASRSAIATAPSSPPTRSHTTTNSSPPKRATKSCGRMAPTSRSASWSSTSSPAWWPRLSLTTLNWSRSTKRSAASRTPSPAAASIPDTRFSSCWRFGNPVSESCRAWWRRRSSTTRRSMAIDVRWAMRSTDSRSAVLGSAGRSSRTVIVPSSRSSPGARIDRSHRPPKPSSSSVDRTGSVTGSAMTSMTTGASSAARMAPPSGLDAGVRLNASVTALGTDVRGGCRSIPPSSTRPTDTTAPATRALQHRPGPVERDVEGCTAGDGLEDLGLLGEQQLDRDLIGDVVGVDDDPAHRGLVVEVGGVDVEMAPTEPAVQHPQPGRARAPAAVAHDGTQRPTSSGWTTSARLAPSNVACSASNISRTDGQA